MRSRSVVSLLLLSSVIVHAQDAEGRKGLVVDVSLGDFEDVEYTVLLTIGSTTAPLVLDTGSSDTWIVSAPDLSNKPSLNPFNLSLYDSLVSSSFQPVASTTDATPARLYYGDASTRTHAFGVVGRERITIASGKIGKLSNTTIEAMSGKNTTVESLPREGVGTPLEIEIRNQLFAAMSDTDTHVLELGAAGIMGLGFGGQSGFSRLVTTSSSDAQDTLPFIARLAFSGLLARQMFSLTLQRAARYWTGSIVVQNSEGRRGILTLGGLPPDVKDEGQMVWANVSLYRDEQTGLSSPKTWEIPIDGVFLDGVRLSDGDQGRPTALVDSGSSWIRGPPTIVNQIFNAIYPPDPPAHQNFTTTTENPYPPGTFPCASPHTLAFLISGTLFPVDPRDFASPYYVGRKDVCVANLVAIDRGSAPSPRRRRGDPMAHGKGQIQKFGAGTRGRRRRGFVSAETGYVWSLGSPFLRSVLASFHYGNLTDPFSDPPRIGLRSTVPSDARARMIANASPVGPKGGPQSQADSTGDDLDSGMKGSKSGSIGEIVRPRWDFGIAPRRWGTYGQGGEDAIVYEPPEGILGLREG